MRFVHACLIIVFSISTISAESYPHQHHIVYAQDESMDAVEISVIRFDEDQSSFCLEEGVSYGYIILNPNSSMHPFNRGLPSQNGSAPDHDNGFMIQIGFNDGNAWSPWLTAGFWKEYIWNSWGKTSWIYRL